MSKINASYTKLRREYLDTSTWLPVCRNCHNWIENNPTESYELGFSGSRS